MRFPLAVVICGMVLSAAQLPLPYSVATVAGSTQVGDGGLATSASLLDAEGVCVDPAGNIYVSDAGDNRLRMIAPSGIIRTLAGTGVAGPLNSPYGVAADLYGNTYVADLGNNRIQKIAGDGTVTTLLGPLASPRNLLADGKGNLYFSEFGGHRVRKISVDGSITVVAGTGVAGAGGDGGPATLAQLRYPAGLALDGSGNLYIADSGNNVIRMVSGGRISTVLGSSGAGALSTPTSVVVDAAGTIYIADTGNQRIRKLSLFGTIVTIPVAARDVALDNNGNLLAATGTRVYRILASGAMTVIAGDGAYFYRGDGGAATSARLNAPAGVAVDAKGNLWIADTANGRVRLVSANGQISTISGGAGQINSPIGLALDASGNVFVADAVGNRIRELVGLGNSLVTIAGTGTAGLGGDGLQGALSQLNLPNGVAVGEGGIIYFADTGNHRVRRMFGSGIVVTVAGDGAAGFNGDGPGQSTKLSSPSGICVDTSGNLYFADTGNNRIRKLTPDGTVMTIAGPEQLNRPRGVAVDSAGNIWIADTGNHRVVALTETGLVEVTNQLQAPVGLAIDRGLGVVYVADTGGNMVVRLSPGPLPVKELPTPVNVVNAATLLQGPVAPGSLISIFGSGLAGAQVFFDGQAAAALMSQDTQVNVQVPLTATGVCQVTAGSKVLAKLMLTIVPNAPGIFTGPGGTGPAVAANQDGTVNSGANGAAPGSVLTFYATGIGSAAIDVLIGGAAAQVLFAGDAPGYLGVTQINAVVPAGIPGGQVALILQAGGIPSQDGVTIAVQ